MEIKNVRNYGEYRLDSGEVVDLKKGIINCTSVFFYIYDGEKITIEYDYTRKLN